MAVYGFAVAAMWISLFASEIVGLLQFFGMLRCGSVQEGCSAPGAACACTPAASPFRCRACRACQPLACLLLGPAALASHPWPPPPALPLWPHLLLSSRL